MKKKGGGGKNRLASYQEKGRQTDRDRQTVRERFAESFQLHLNRTESQHGQTRYTLGLNADVLSPSVTVLQPVASNHMPSYSTAKVLSVGENK